MDYSKLTEEQKAKVLACKTPEDIIELAKTEGYDLSDDELDAITGGENGEKKLGWTDPYRCGNYTC